MWKFIYRLKCPFGLEQINIITVNTSVCKLCKLVAYCCVGCRIYRASPTKFSFGYFYIRMKTIPLFFLSWPLPLSLAISNVLSNYSCFSLALWILPEEARGVKWFINYCSDRYRLYPFHGILVHRRLTPVFLSGCPGSPVPIYIPRGNSERPALRVNCVSMRTPILAKAVQHGSNEALQGKNRGDRQIPQSGGNLDGNTNECHFFAVHVSSNPKTLFISWIYGLGYCVIFWCFFVMIGRK